MARAASGAGAVTAPNSILAGGPFGAGFPADFLAAPTACAVAGFVADFMAGLICFAETAPQMSNSTRPSVSLRMDRLPRFPSPHGQNLAQKMVAIGVPRLWELEPRRSVLMRVSEIADRR